MKKWLLHIFLVSVLGMLTASCSQEADDPTQVDDMQSGTIRIQFSLAMDESRVGSRAEWGTETGGTIDTPAGDNKDRVIGSDYENKINLDHLHVFLFDTNGTYLGEVSNLEMITTTSAIEYTFKGEITVNGVDVKTNSNGGKYLDDYTIMVTANYENYINGNVAVTYNYLFDYIANNYRPDASGVATSYIPMWGMLKTDIPLYPEGAEDTDFTKISDIYMLRSMAKIEVVLDKDNVPDDYTITGATLNKYNQQGYLLPAKFEVTNNGTTTYSYFNAASTSAFDTEDYINAYASTVTNSLAFNLASDKRSCVIYVPEYVALSTDLNINLQISRGTTPISENLNNKGTFTLNQTQLVRNHWYRCTVKTISDGFDLTVQAMPWTKQSVEMSFTDIVSYNVTGWTAGTTGDIDNNLVYMTKDKTAEFTFRIVTPTGLTKDDLEIGLTNNQDFSLNYEFTNDGSIKISISPTDTESNGSALRTSLYAFVKDQYGRNVELDLTGTGTGDQEVGSTTQTKANRFTIIRTW